jgi:hypothetical protein
MSRRSKPQPKCYRSCTFVVLQYGHLWAPQSGHEDTLTNCRAVLSTVCGIFEGGNADTLTHCFEVLSVGFRILEGGNGNGNGMAAQAHCGKVSIGQAGVVVCFFGPCHFPSYVIKRRPVYVGIG